MMTNAHVTPDSIFQVASGFMASKHLFVANEVGLFEQLADGPRTLDELAERTHVPRRTIRILADAMVALGFVEQQEGRYQNGTVAATFLSGRTPADLRPFLRFWNQSSYPLWMQLETSVRTGEAGHLDLPEELSSLYNEGVEAVSAGAAMALAANYDFGRHHRLIDLGGGTGSFLLAILRQHSNVETTLFELPEAVAIARPRLRRNPLGEHVKMIEGDFFRDPIPDGYDAFILANVVHTFSPEHNLTLFRRIRERVADHGRLLLVDFWTDPTHTQPTFAALVAGEMLVNFGEGDIYSVEEASEWLQQTGWRSLEHIPLAGPASLIVAEAV
jgi:SAM-dependent methyltransferase